MVNCKKMNIFFADSPKWMTNPKKCIWPFQEKIGPMGLRIQNMSKKLLYSDGAMKKGLLVV